jgi:hypothetical protein
LAGGELEWLLPVKAGSRVEAMRSAMDVAKQSCWYNTSRQTECGPLIYAYDLSPSALAGVTWSGVQPLRIRPPAGANMQGDTVLVELGKPVTFYLDAIDGMSEFEWFYSESGWTCRPTWAGVKECTITPTQNRMSTLVTYAKYNYGSTRQSPYLYMKPQPPELGLDCPDSVQRGSTMTCYARPVGGSMTEAAWTFTDLAGVAPIPAPAGTTSSWGGIMVVSGTMRLRAKVAGLQFDTARSVTVTSRTWPKMRLAAVDSGHYNLPDPPTKMGDLGQTYFPRLRDPLPLQAVTSGPNIGWSYLRNPVTHMVAVVMISRAFNSSHPWFQMQHAGTVVDPVTGNSVPACTQADIASLEQVTREHEGLLQGPSPSHVSGYSLFFQNNDPQVDVEWFTYHVNQTGGNPMMDFARAHFQTYVLTPLGLHKGGEHIIDGGTVPFPTFHCYPRF